MQSVLAYLPLLACPIGMGLMMWLMMRGQPQQRGGQHVQADTNSSRQPASETGFARAIGLCLNWKVVAVLALVGIGIWLVAPHLLWASVPLLILLACPLSMLVMMRGMRHR